MKSCRQVLVRKVQQGQIELTDLRQNREEDIVPDWQISNDGGNLTKCWNSLRVNFSILARAILVQPQKTA